MLVKPKVIPTDGAYRYRPAMISEAEEGEGREPASYGVIYDEEDGEDGDEEDEVTADRITAAPRAAPCVSCAARLNLARCRYKEARHPEVRTAARAVVPWRRWELVDFHSVALSVGRGSCVAFEPPGSKRLVFATRTVLCMCWRRGERLEAPCGGGEVAAGNGSQGSTLVDKVHRGVLRADVPRLTCLGTSRLELSTTARPSFPLRNLRVTRG